MIKISCPVCKREFSNQEYKLSRFCPDCGKYLEQARVIEPIFDPPPENGPIKLGPDDAQISRLWPVYMKSPIEITSGNKFPSVDEWVRRRKQIYIVYRRKLDLENLGNLQALKDNFYDWLMFRNNLSWTTLQRTASYALDHPQELSNLLRHLQDENVGIGSRIRYALQGSGRINGIGQGIVTALLHTLNPDRYGVWNSRTIDTLQKLHQPTFPSEDLGATYERVNKTLNELARELRTDLTTIDGFMWFVSKNYIFL